MTKEKKSTINVQGSAITILRQKDDDFICLTDMAKKFGGDDLIYSWMRNRNTLEFLGIWEQIHNPEFKGVEFDTFKKEAGLNSFRLTPKKLANMESMNAEFIRMELPQPDRLKKLNTIAIQQLKSLTTNPNVKKLGDGK